MIQHFHFKLIPFVFFTHTDIEGRTAKCYCWPQLYYCNDWHPEAKTCGNNRDLLSCGWLYSKDALCNAQLSYASQLNNIYLAGEIDLHLNKKITVFTCSLDEGAFIISPKITKSFSPRINIEIHSAMTAHIVLEALLKLQEHYGCEHKRNVSNA